MADDSQTTNLPGPITAMVSYPAPPKLTLWEWLGFKPRPSIIPERLYAAVGSTIFVSDVNGKFDYSLNMTHASTANFHSESNPMPREGIERDG